MTINMEDCETDTQYSQCDIEMIFYQTYVWKDEAYTIIYIHCLIFSIFNLI